MATSDTVLDLSDLLDEPELPADPTGVLAGLGDWLAPLGCQAVVLCRADGRLMASACWAPGWSRVELETFCRTLVERGRAAAGQAVVLSTLPDQSVGLALAVESPGESGFLGMLLEPGRAGQEWVSAIRPGLAACARAAWVALHAHTQAVQAQTRLRHLESEHATLRSSHRQATNGVIQEREERIRQQLAYHARMDAVLRTAADGIIVADQQGRIETFNAAAERIFGYSAQEATGKFLGDLLPFLRDETENGRLLPRLEPDDCQRHALRREVLALRKDGSTCPLEVAISTTCVDESRIFTVLARDISERKRAEEELRRLHLQNDLILNSAGEGIFGVDPQGRFIFINPAGAKMLGYEPQELIRRPCREVLGLAGTPSPQADPAALIEHTLADGLPRSLETAVLPRRNDSTFPARYTCMPIRDRERTSGVVVTFADITEQKRLQQQLAQAQKLESIGQLAAGIAHEINTPTQYIGDNIRFLRDAMSDLNPLLQNCFQLESVLGDRDALAELAADIAAAAEAADLGYLLDEIPKAICQSLEGVERVTKIVRSMKEFSHPGSEEKQAVDLNRALESTLTVSRNEWKYVADVVTRFDPDLPPVTCLPADLNQVFLNLIINAAHAIEAKRGGREGPKGTITVSTRRDGPWAEVVVRDTGTGIPQAIWGKIFDPFFTTKKVGRGTGQGLAIARAIVVERHGGTITFQTEEGVGTAFVVRIPIDPQDASQRSPNV